MLLLHWYNYYYKPFPNFFDIDSFSIEIETNTKVQTEKITCLTDLSDELLLIICEYLRPIDALRAFLSNNTSDRFHRLIVEYRTNVNLSTLSYSEFRYMVDIVLPQLNPSNLRLSNAHIPCLTDRFVSSCHRFLSMKTSSLELYGCVPISNAFISWLSSQTKLETLYVEETSQDEEVLTSTDLNTLRKFLFIDGIPSSVKSISFNTSLGFILNNQLNSSILSQINYAFLQLDTVTDLQILLNKGILCNVSSLHIHLKHQRQVLNEQDSSLFLHKNLVNFSLGEHGSGIRLEELAVFIRHMPALKALFVCIALTEDQLFARHSLVENVLPQSITEFEYFARFTCIILNNIETDIDDSSGHRFPMKIHKDMIYTVPWRWFMHRWSFPIEDYHQSCIDKTKTIFVTCLEEQEKVLVDTLKPWCHATTVESSNKLPSLNLFRGLRTLKTIDATVIHSKLPSTLRVLEFIDDTPLDLNAPLSNLVHSQVYKLTLNRSIHNEQDLLNILHQFPNLRFLSINLPSTILKECLYYIFHNNNARLPHLICLQVYGGKWLMTPDDEWLTTYTPLKYRSIPFHAEFCGCKNRLIVWL